MTKGHALSPNIQAIKIFQLVERFFFAFFAFVF